MQGGSWNVGNRKTRGELLARRGDLPRRSIHDGMVRREARQKDSELLRKGYKKAKKRKKKKKKWGIVKNIGSVHLKKVI